MNLREQGCWLALVFESHLSTREVNDILVRWCKQLGRTVEEFFAADVEEWKKTCQLNEKIVQKLMQAKEKLVAQAFLVEQLQRDTIHMMTVLDAEYPKLLKEALGRNQIPPLLFYMGDLSTLERQTIAIIGSRNANEASITFTRAAAQFLANQGANVISGNARGIDRTAYDGAMSASGHTTVVLPHGIRKLSRVQFRTLQARAETGNVLLLSQFHPDAPWVVSRAMERNKIVTGLAQIVIVAESDIKGGTWEGAKSALAQKRLLYVRQADATSLPGNEALLQLGGKRLVGASEGYADTFVSLLQESSMQRQRQDKLSERPEQTPLFIAAGE